MMRRVSLIKRHSAHAGWWLLFLQGVLLIALAGLVLYQPAVLVHLAAAVLLVAGLCCMVLAWRIRQIGRSMTCRYWSESWWADAL
jgi:uncharacterized membrane protein HdeD (DUF308 family)